MRHSDPIRSFGCFWLVVVTGCIACNGSGSSTQGVGGASASATGGRNQVGTVGGGSGIASGGTSQLSYANAGGTTSAGGPSTASGTPSGGVSTGGAATGGSTSSTDAAGAQGSKNTAGAASVGGASKAGGSGLMGGASSSSSGTTSAGGVTAARARGDGICSAGTYSAPDLSGTASLATSSTNAGQYEGTLWLDSKGVLLFSGMDTSVGSTTVVPATVGQLTPPSTVKTSVVEDSGTNGLAIDFTGRVLGCSQGNAKLAQGIVLIDLSAGSVSTLVSADASGRHFNSPNDLTVRTDGTIYFTDPDYQIAGRTSETGVKGVYQVSPSNVVSVVDSQFNEPNGITLSPDETALYVADTAANAIRKFTVLADGSTSSKATFASMPSPDGGTTDCAGNVYWASNSTPGKVYVFSPRGTQLGSIAVGTSDKPTNLAFGGADHKTLYISTAPRKVYSVSMSVPGFPY